METIKVGDLVNVNDSSYLVRVDKFSLSSPVDHGDDFEVIANTNFGKLQSSSSSPKRVHDIFIKDIATGNIYLHSSSFVHKIPTPPQEMTVAEISKKLGYTVKVVE